MKKETQPVTIAAVVDLLEGLGFGSSGTNLRRLSCDRRVVQIVTLQKGRTWLTGKFTMELGCFLPSVYQVETGERPPREPRITQCHIRERLGHFVGTGDLWWKSDDPGDIDVLAAAVQRDVPLFFERFGEVRAILEAWRQGPLPMGSPYAPPVLLHEEGRDEEAREYIQRWRQTVVGNKGDAGFLSGLTTALGLNVQN